VPSDVDICNLSLGFIGADAIITSIDPPDGTAEAGHCARVYPIARRELLDTYAYSFAKTRVQLAEVTNTSAVWSYAYALPSDCLNPLRVLTLDVLSDAALYPWCTPYPLNEELGLYTERGTADFQVEGGVLRTHQPQAVLLYTTDVVDSNRFSPTFVTALGMLTGSYLAGPIVKGQEGANTMARLRQTVFGPGGVAGAARMADANGSAEAAEYLPTSLSVRA
jgi:hypothetical protein